MNDSVIFRSYVTGEYYSVPCRSTAGHPGVIVSGQELDKVPSANELRGVLRKRSQILVVG